MDANDVQKVASELRQMIHDLEKRVGNIESNSQRDDAVEAVRRDNDRKDVERLTGRISSMEEIVRRLVWLVVTITVSAFLAYVFSGGLRIAPL